ncbi:Aste57867_13267 [Aphanomyces stellatus]|uniref:Aste57867_13267 protein n=1 Tax=Aphanomyces stellatus TaxID=120398 RepID=A0A485KY51_9STRA|nr:hypothetical protein As57867_013218 [Aphanomyces stellatus]VFT90107.1 Aste57867_13267 [Aphanomyces stellatus]
MFRAPAVVDLVSSSSEEDDSFPIETPKGYTYEPVVTSSGPSLQLDEPMEIEEDEPFETTAKTSPPSRAENNVANALESVLKDLESEEDEAFETTTDVRYAVGEPHMALPQEEDADASVAPLNQDEQVDEFLSSMNGIVMKSKYGTPDREEGELSDDPNFADDESFQQKQMEAAYLREAQVAHRKAALIKIAQSAKANAPTTAKKNKKNKKRKLHEAALLPHPNTGYSPMRKVHHMAPESIVRLHRNVMMDTSPTHNFRAVHAPPPPPILIPPPAAYVSPPPPPSSPSSRKARQVFYPVPPPPPENDEDDEVPLFDLESLRNAVKRSVKKPKLLDTPVANKDDVGMPAPARTQSPEGESNSPSPENHGAVEPIIVDAVVNQSKQPAVVLVPVPPQQETLQFKAPPLPSPPPSSSIKMALGPNKWNKKPLTACSQTLVINLSLQDCEEMRRRHAQVQMSIEEGDPIMQLKQKIAAREEELLRKAANKVPSPPSVEKPMAPPATEAVAVAQSHVTRLEKRIRELKQLIAQKEAQHQRTT